MRNRTTMLAIATFVTTPAAAGTVFHVDDDAAPGGDGATWATAYRFLQDALSAAAGGTSIEVRVAQGTYRPDRSADAPEGTGDRDATFGLINGVAVRGGYAGLGEPDPDLRDPALFVTVLSGDLAGDDGPDFDCVDDNGYSVVNGASGVDGTAVLDGVTVSGGNADEAFDPDHLERTFGGGLWNFEASPTVHGCIFTSNRALLGGGIANEDLSSPAISSSRFTGNQGGGISNRSGSSPTIAGCEFVANVASSDGAGMRSQWGCHPLVTDCLFLDNVSQGWGGGMYSLDGSDPIVLRCRFIGNESRMGGGLTSHNTFGRPIVAQCLFTGNHASGPSPGRGGAIGTHSDSDMVLVNCTIVGNTADVAGGAFYNNFGDGPDASSCVIRDNVPDAVDGAAVTIVFSNVEGGYPGPGNVDADALLDEGFRLRPGSPCIDAGNNDALPDGDALDLDGKPRLFNDPDTVDTGFGTPPIVDMGAFEFQGPCPHDADGDGTVGVADLAAVILGWGPCGADCPADANGDGVVDVADLSEVVVHWGPCRR